MIELDDLVTIDEAADHTGKNPNTLRAAVRRGRLRARKMGHGQKVLIVTTLADVARYVAEVESWKREGRRPHVRAVPGRHL